MNDYKLGTGLVDGEATPLVLCDGKIYAWRDVLGGDAVSSLDDVFADWASFDPLIAERVPLLAEAAALVGDRRAAGAHQAGREAVDAHTEGPRLPRQRPSQRPRPASRRLPARPASST